jgi:Flp pilus assembly protein TadB
VATPLAAGALGVLSAVALAGTLAARRLAGDRTERGARAATAALPIALELVAATLRAGAPLDRGLALAGGCTDPALARLLVQVRTEAATGRPVASALVEVAARSGVEALATVAGLVERRQRLGLPLAPPLVAIASALRAQARAECLARAARRGPLASVVTATVVAPACALALLCAVLAGLLRGGHLLGPG